MKTRLSHLLVAGAAACVAWQPIAAGPANDTPLVQSTHGGPSHFVKVDSESATADVAKFHLGLSDFKGTPRCQVFTNPLRVVVDLPNVVCASPVGGHKANTMAVGPVARVRVAQLTSGPAPVTRAVFKIAKGTQTAWSVDTDGLTLTFAKGDGDTRVTRASASPEAKSAKAMLLPEPQAGQGIKPFAMAVPFAPIGSVDTLPTIGASRTALPGAMAATMLPTLTQPPVQAVPAPEKFVDRPESGTRAGRVLGDSQQRYTGSKITIDVKGAELSSFLRLLADHAKMNLIADPDVQGQTYDFKFTDTPWDLVLDTILKHAGLGKEMNNGIIRVAKIEKLQKEEEDRKKFDDAKALAGDLVSVTRPLSFCKSNDAKAILEKVITKRGSVIVDDRTNTLIISDLPRNIKVIDELLAQMDVSIQQVQIEARVVEASKTFSRSFGVKWPTSSSASSGGTTTASTSSDTWNSWNSASSKSGNTTVAFNGGANSVTSIAAPAGELWVSFLRNNFNVNFVLQAAETDGTVKMVSNPKVVTQNNKKAKILSGRKIPYPTTQSGSSGAITVAFADANLELDVTPQITNDGTVLMDLKLTKSEADFSNTVSGTPTIVNKEIETQVMVKDGGTAILGGVYTSTTSASSTGVPFLMKIPVLGALFRNKTRGEDNTELLLFITPRIIKNQ